MVSFVHHYNVQINFSNLSDDYFSLFTTCHEYISYNWLFYFQPQDIMMVDRPAFVLSREDDLLASPLPATVKFELKIYDHTTSELLHAPVPLICEAEPEYTGIFAASPPQTPVSFVLEEMMNNNLGGEYRLEFVITLNLREEHFQMAELKNTVNFYPLETDFRHAALEDPARHDFTFLCRNGTYAASRESLNTGSPYFRELFEKNRNLTSIEENAHWEAVKVVVIYLICGEFSPPPQMSPPLAADIIRLAYKYTVQHTCGLLLAVENSCCEELELTANRLEGVLCWLRMTEETYRRLSVLSTAVHSLLLTRHWNDLVVDHGDPSKWSNPFHELLHSSEDDESLFAEMRRHRLKMVPAFQRLAKTKK